MTSEVVVTLMPYFVLTAGLLVLLLPTAFLRGHLVALIVTLISLLAVLYVTPASIESGPQTLSDLIVIDGVALFFNVLFILAAIVTTVTGYRYLESRSRSYEEFYILVVTSTLGAMTMAAAEHFASFILGLEILSISLYALIAYPERGRASLEAATKYLILSGVASTTILFGMALVYVSTGSMTFSETLASDSSGTIYALGQSMILLGLAFKLSLVPFHMWTPDVYEGAPAPITGFVATISKGAVFVLLLRYAIETQWLSNASVTWAIGLIAIASMVIGNLLALLQEDIKRLLAYSSIAHVGYLLVALVFVSTSDSAGFALESAMFYVSGYFLMTLVAFGVVTVMSTGVDEDAGSLRHYEGLYWRRPMLAAALTIAALSLAGIPLTVGFIAKFYLFAVGVSGALWTLIWALILGSAIGIYYYLRIVISMIKREAEKPVERSQDLNAVGTVTVVLLGVSIVILGIYPTPLIAVVQQLLQSFGA